MELKTQHYIAIGTGLALAFNWKAIAGLFDGDKEQLPIDDGEDDFIPPPPPPPRKDFPIVPSTQYNPLVETVQEALKLHNPQSRKAIEDSGGADGIYGGGTRTALSHAGFSSNSISKATFDNLKKLLEQNAQVETPAVYAQRLHAAIDSFFVDTDAIFQVFREIPTQSFSNQVEQAYTRQYGLDLFSELKRRLWSSDYKRIQAMLAAKGLSGIDGGCGCKNMYAPLAMTITYLDRPEEKAFVSKNELIGKLLGVKQGIAVFERPDQRIAAIKYK